MHQQLPESDETVDNIMDNYLLFFFFFFFFAELRVRLNLV